MDKFEEYKQYAEDFLQTYFGVDTRKNFKCLCPTHNDDNPSMGFNRDKHQAHCFSCDACYDIYDLVGIYFNLPEVKDQLQKVEQLYDHGTTNPVKTKSNPKPTKKQEEQPELKIAEIKAYCEECKNNAYKTDYFGKRGLLAETVSRCNLGFDEKENAIVIPYSKTMEYFQRRNVLEKKFYKPKSSDAGQEPIYNMQALRLKIRKPVFVVESALCAISIIQCGGQAIALNGTGAEKLYTMVKAKKPLGTLILALDNDEPGKEHSAKIRQKLIEMDVKVLTYNIADECKDPNDLLMKDSERLTKNIEKAIFEGRKLTATKYDSQPLEVMMKKDYPPTTWIVEKFIPTGLSLLASPSKSGKSWMMLQLAQCIVEQTDFLGFSTKKCDVEYMALEDTEVRIVNRMKIHRANKPPVPHGIYISTKAPTLDNDELLDVIAEKMEENPKLKLFIIDTLQKVRKTKTNKYDSNMYAGDYAELSLMKEFAEDNNIGIFVVHHTRKTKDTSDPFSNMLGSTGIQGVPDTLIVLDKDNTTQQSKMFYKGRDTGENCKVIEFDDDKKGGTFLWTEIGSPEEQEAERKKREYENNPIVKTIKSILKNNPSGWSGNATDIMNAIYDVTGQSIATTSAQIGKDLQYLATKLHADGIDVCSKRTGEKRIHTFTYGKKPSWMNTNPSYQPKMFDD